MVRIISTKKGRPLLPSLRSKYFFHLLLSLVLVAVAALGMVSIVIYYQFFQEYRQDTIDSTYANVASVESMLTQRLLDMKSTVLTSSSNVAFSYYPYENEQKEESVDAVRQLQTMLKVNRLYADVGFYRTSEPEWIYTSKGQFSLRDFGVYLYQMESPAAFNPVSFFNVYTGVSRQGSLKDETVYAFVDRLDAGIGKPRKFILLFVYKSAFDEIVAGIFNDLPYGFYIYDENDQLLYSHGEEAQAAEAGAREPLPEGEACVERKSGGAAYTYFQTTSAYNEWKYVAAVRTDKLFSLYDHKLLQFNIFAVLIGVGLVIVCGFFALWNYGPIGRLFGKVRHSFSEILVGHRRVDEIQYIDRLVDSLVESRIENRRKSVLSNILWGQYEKEEDARDDCDEAAIDWPYDAFVVGVVRLEKKNPELLRGLEQAMDSLSAICYTLDLSDKHLDAFLINYDPKELNEEMLARHLGKGNWLPTGGVVGLSMRQDELVRLHSAFLEGKSALKCPSPGQESSRVVRYTETAVDIRSLDIPGFKKKMGTCIKQGDPDRAADRLGEFLEIFCDPAVPYETFRYVYYSVLSVYNGLVRDLDLPEDEDFLRIQSELLNDTKLSRSYVEAQLERLAVSLCDRACHSEEDDNALLEDINQVIQQRLCDPLMSLETLAEECHVSTSYLGRYFKRKTGYTPMRYVDMQRMEYAKKLLRETDHSLNEIVAKSGYIDASNFIRKFKKDTGMTPINYRKKYTV